MNTELLEKLVEMAYNFVAIIIFSYFIKGVFYASSLLFSKFKENLNLEQKQRIWEYE